jgi:transcriptional regulator with XRE-family HTH domain
MHPTPSLTVPSRMRSEKLQTPNETPDPIDIYVGHRLREIRRSKNISQAQLGMAVDVSFQQVQKYERGANRVSASVLVKLARHLDVSAADLLPPVDYPVEEHAPLLTLTTTVRGMHELIMSLTHISERRLQLMVALARDLADHPYDTPALHAASNDDHEPQQD